MPESVRNGMMNTSANTFMTKKYHGRKMIWKFMRMRIDIGVG